MVVDTWKFALHPWKPTWHWKIPIFNRKYIFKWWIFHCHVSFRGGKKNTKQKTCHKLPKFPPPPTCIDLWHSRPLLTREEGPQGPQHPAVLSQTIALSPLLVWLEIDCYLCPLDLCMVTYLWNKFTTIFGSHGSDGGTSHMWGGRNLEQTCLLFEYVNPPTVISKM